MKYEEIKIGESYTVNSVKERVIAKVDEDKSVATVDDSGIITGWYGRELESFGPLKEELPEEGLLVHNLGAIVYRTGEISGYGFDFNKDYQNYNDYKVGWTFNSTPKDWRKATEQEEEKFVEMLEKECKKRGLFKNTKIEKHAVGRPLCNPDYMRVAPMFNSTVGYNKNGQIFYKGKFATPLKETATMPQVGKQYTHKKGNTYTVIGFTNNLGDKEDKDFPVTVVYVDREGRHWSRPLSRWHGSFELKG